MLPKRNKMVKMKKKNAIKKIIKKKPAYSFLLSAQIELPVEINLGTSSISEQRIMAQSFFQVHI